MPDADDIIEMMQCSAHDNSGEASDGFPDVSEKAKAALDALLTAWAEAFVVVNFWIAVGDAEIIETSADPRTETP
jgi:hypothetical protein